MSKELPPTEALELFYSYSHKDEDLRDELETHLSMLKRQRVISDWHDRGIVAGEEWGGEIDEHLKAADIILLLVSADFLASDYCYDIEMGLAMERHEAGEARVIPIILRPCDWTGAPFGKLQALPRNARPVKRWPNTDEAFTDVAKGIRKAAEALLAQRRAAVQPAGAAGGGQTTSAPKAVSSSIPRPPVVGFVSRRDERGRDIVELLGKELAPGKNQLVALWGPGGSGKTTLAAEFVRATGDAFEGRVAWVSALGRVDFSLATLLDETATRLGREDLRKLASEAKLAEVAALISDAPTLVVLDNFETISDEEQRHCLDFLAQFAACPALITTRSRVNRDDVYNVPLAAMSMDEARDFLRRLVERTRKPSNFGRLDRDGLIRSCEANPLVLQWVVRQIDLAKRPQDVLDDLARGEGDAAERVFTRSFNLPRLGEDGRAALLALSLFTPDASRAALAEVAGFGDNRGRLSKAVESLSALWLVETTEGNERLFLRGLTREMAKSRLSQDARADEFRRRFVSHFLNYAVAHEDRTPEALDALRAERDNLFGAIDGAFWLRLWEGGMRIRSALDDFLFLHGYWDEAVRTGESAQAAAHEAKNDTGVAHFMACVAMIRMNRGEYEEAGAGYRKAVEIFVRLGDEKNVAACLTELGNVASLLGKAEEAERLYRESLEISKRLGDPSGIASAAWGLSTIARERGDVDEAKRLLLESLAAFTELNDQVSAAGVRHQLGNVAYKQGNLEEARRYYVEGLKIRNSLGDQKGVAVTLNQLGMLAEKQGDIEEARRLYVNSLDIKRKLNDQLGIANTVGNLGMLAAEEGDREEAARLLREALCIFQRLGSPNAAEARKKLARVEGEADSISANGGGE